LHLGQFTLDLRPQLTRHELLLEEASGPKQRITERVMQITDLSNNENLQARRRQLKTRWPLAFRGLALLSDMPVLARLTPDLPSVPWTFWKNARGDSKDRRGEPGPVGVYSHKHPIGRLGNGICGSWDRIGYLVMAMANPTTWCWAPFPEAPEAQLPKARLAQRSKAHWDWRGWECRCKTVVLCRWVGETCYITSLLLIRTRDRQIGLSG
jgi:hypothetical protein